MTRVLTDTGTTTQSRWLTNVGGAWRNQFGSVLTLEPSLNHQLRGTFQVRTGSCFGPLHPVAGTSLLVGESGRQVVAFHVAWPEADSVTVWCGEYEPDEDLLTTTWLMTGEPDGASPRWSATSIGHDVFSRFEPFTPDNDADEEEA